MRIVHCPSCYVPYLFDMRAILKELQRLSKVSTPCPNCTGLFTFVRFKAGRKKIDWKKEGF